MNTMSIKTHAMREFRAAGWLDENGNFKDGMQKLICEQVLELLEKFSEHGHSGSSAPYAINLFKTLASYEPIVPLTGEDWEWNEVGDNLWQNIRCSHVFKGADGLAYDGEGKIFSDWYERDLEPDEEGYPGKKREKSHFTSRYSRVYITFPYTPTREYIEADPNRP